jgi:glycosyl transferase family 25
MNLNKILNIDKIYVINLEREKENKQMMIKKLKKYNIQADFVKAVDSKDKNIIEEYKYYKNKHIIPFDVTKSGDLYRSCGAYACLLSHIKVLKDAIKNDYNRICIFQDDIIFHKNFYNELLDKIKKIPKWDILYLGQCGNKKFNPIDYYKCNNSIRGFFAVVLNKNIFIKLYKLLKKKIIQMILVC